jgi:hypothetical protein
MGETLRYWLQNSDKEDFIKLTASFIKHLLLQCNQIEQLPPMLQAAASYIDHKNTTGNSIPVT